MVSRASLFVGSCVLHLCLSGCGEAALSAAVPAPSPVAPVVPPPPDPVPGADLVAVGTALTAALNDEAGGAVFADMTAPTVVVTLLEQCDESPRDVVSTLADAAAKDEWHRRSSSSWSARCDEVPRPSTCRWAGRLQFHEHRVVCDTTCCVQNDIGHGAPYLHEFCSENGKIVSLVIEDGC